MSDAKKNSSGDAAACGHGCQSHGAAEPRRQFLGVSVAAGLLGGLVGLVPAIPGFGVFLDPMLRSRKKAGAAAAGESDKLLRVGTVDGVPADGTPIQVPVIADLTDVWNRESNQPIGSVFLRRLANGSIQCFNSICPHAGCKVSYAEDRKVFQCPCHTSSFELDGKAIQPSPSPRDMDPLDVTLDNGDIKIKFVNYLPGKVDRVAK